MNLNATITVNRWIDSALASYCIIRDIGATSRILCPIQICCTITTFVPRCRYSSSGAPIHASPIGQALRMLYRTHPQYMGRVDRRCAFATTDCLSQRVVYVIKVNSHMLRQIRRLRKRSEEDSKNTRCRVLRVSTYLPQYVHLNGFCPLWVRLWMVRAPVIANAFPQPRTSHTYGSVDDISTGTR